MTGRELIRWSRLHDRRARAGWSSPPIIALGLGGAFAGLVSWRQTLGPIAASHAWLAGTIVAFALAFLRVPFLMYWRADASLLAQLPIEGAALFDAALARCIRAATTTTAVAVLGAAPLAAVAPELALRHAAIAGALGLAAAFLLPAVVVWSASLVAQGGAAVAYKAFGATAPAAQGPPVGASATLGAVPGFAATAILVPILIASPWLTGGAPALPAPIVLAAVAGVSLLGIAAARGAIAGVMSTILRDVSALDRQRLASLEIRPPTALERAIGRMLGDGALPYEKLARLVRRRYPMAFALGALAFIVLIVVGIARPADPIPWLVATIASAAAYAVTLAGRLGQPPLEIPRLSATLPIAPAALARARRAWLVGWWTIFVLTPGLFAVLRQPEPLVGLALLGAGTVLAAVA